MFPKKKRQIFRCQIPSCQTWKEPPAKGWCRIAQHGSCLAKGLHNFWGGEGTGPGSHQNQGKDHQQRRHLRVRLGR